MKNDNKTTKEEIKAAIAVAIEGLEKKNKELLKKLRDHKDKYGDVNIDELLATKTAYDKIQTDQKKADNQYKKLYEEALTTAETHKKEAEEAKQQVKDMQISMELRAKLTSSNIDPVLLDVVETLFRPQVEMVDNTLHVDGEDFKSHLEKWAETDIGKKFVLDANSGSDASGNDSGSSNAMEKYFDPKSDDFNRTKQAELYKKDPTKAAALASKYTK